MEKAIRKRIVTASGSSRSLVRNGKPVLFPRPIKERNHAMIEDIEEVEQRCVFVTHPFEK
jgi:type II secretory pathway predicted ATPase ExeA